MKGSNRRGTGAKRMKRPLVKVLIVHEAPIVRAGMRVMLLHAPDIRVVGETGETDHALRLLKSRNPHVVLLADRVREAESVDLVRRIKERLPQTSVIFVTTKESAFYLSLALSRGCSGCVLKTVDGKKLANVVRAVARGERVVEPPFVREAPKDVATLSAGGKVRPLVELRIAEKEVLRLITEGHTNREIARRLKYSLGTVKDYVHQILHKLEVSDRTQAAVKAVRLGLID